MRVITWNCNMAFRHKADHILKYKPDILVVPECEHPDKIIFSAKKKPSGIIWYGENQHKGLAIFSFNGYTVSLLPQHNPIYKTILPIQLNYKKYRFILFGIWANNPVDKGYQYSGQIWKALKEYEPLLNHPHILLAGDFNSNTIWDRPKRVHNHTALVEKLAQKKIVSAYHHYFNQIQGKEKHPTLYMYRHQNKPYHIDYCFASLSLIKKLNFVKVGRFNKWKDKSDHTPLIADFAL